MTDRRKLYGEISKTEPQDDGTIKVYGYASSEAVDHEGEVIKAEAMREALPGYLKWANVREMHDKKAAGVCIEAEVQDDGRTWFGAHIIDAEACKKIEHKVYKGFSIGGRVTSRDDVDKTIITGLELVEVSLVDRPANPEAVFVMHKADGVDDAPAAADPVVTAPAVVAPAVEPKEAAELVVTGSDDEVAAFAKALNDGGMTMADAIAAVQTAAAAKAAPVVAPAAEPIDKGMYSLQDFAGALSCIAGLAASAEDESEWEGDDSPVPEKLRTWLAAGIAIFKDMAAEESSELLAALQEQAGADNPGMVMMTLAANTRALAKELGSESLTLKRSLELSAQFEEPLGEGFATRVLAKAGARHSKADMDRLQAAHDHLANMGAKCAKDSAAPAEVTKVAESNVELTTVKDELTKALGRIKALEAQPMPTRVALRAVSKSQDLDPSATTGDFDPGSCIVRKADGEIDAAASVIKAIQATGAQPLQR